MCSASFACSISSISTSNSCILYNCNFSHINGLHYFCVSSSVRIFEYYVHFANSQIDIISLAKPVSLQCYYCWVSQTQHILNWMYSPLCHGWQTYSLSFLKNCSSSKFLFWLRIYCVCWQLGHKLGNHSRQPLFTLIPPSLKIAPTYHILNQY